VHAVGTDTKFSINIQDQHVCVCAMGASVLYGDVLIECCGGGVDSIDGLVWRVFRDGIGFILIGK